MKYAYRELLPQSEKTHKHKVERKSVGLQDNIFQIRHKFKCQQWNDTKNTI